MASRKAPEKGVFGPETCFHALKTRRDTPVFPAHFRAKLPCFASQCPISGRKSCTHFVFFGMVTGVAGVAGLWNVCDESTEVEK